MTSFRNKMANMVMKPLLQSPLHFFASGGVMLITFTGKKSGKVYTTPVQYKQDGDTVRFLSTKERVWWRNLRGGVPVTLRIKGQDVEGIATPHEAMSEADLIVVLKSMYPRIKDEQAADFAQTMLLITVALNA